jgi:hypothetical protein
MKLNSIAQLPWLQYHGRQVLLPLAGTRGRQLLEVHVVVHLADSNINNVLNSNINNPYLQVVYILLIVEPSI